MSIFSLIANLCRVVFSSSDFYRVMNVIFQQFYGRNYMLHYPFYRKPKEDLLQCQKNLTDYCLSKLPSLYRKSVIEIGCGNGVHTIYILREHNPGYITGVDINPSNIFIAQEEKQKGSLERVDFLVDNAHELSHIKDSSVDVVISIESAFHYPDKPLFLEQMRRVLKPAGCFVIADILNRKVKSKLTAGVWQKRMNLNHWTLYQYMNAMKRAGLEITRVEDISKAILKGYKRSCLWSSSFVKRNALKAMLVYNWGKTMASINSILLMTVRRYYVLVGMKP